MTAKDLARLQAANARIARTSKAGDITGRAEARRDQTHAKLAWIISQMNPVIKLTRAQHRDLVNRLGQISEPEPVPSSTLREED